jgi:putative spermidine/putrescine transport system substrate-binding protein
VSGLSRRSFLAGAGAGAAAAALARPGVARAAPAFDGTIRVLGLGYDLIDQVRKPAEQELGLTIVNVAKDSATIQRLVRQEPGEFDILSCFQLDIAQFWEYRNLQPVNIGRVTRWKDVTPLYPLGRANPLNTRSRYGQGDAAFRRLYVDPDRSDRWPNAPRVSRAVQGELVQWVDEKTGKRVGAEPRFATGVPSCFNFDSFGYNHDIVPKRPVELSWAELLNKRWGGRVGLNNQEPRIGLQDMANTVQAAGLMRFRDLGDPTRKEIDRLVKLLLTYRKQFYGVWVQFGEPSDWMRAGKVVLCTMYAPDIARLRALKFPIRQSAPREGYRAFGGLMSISAQVTDPAKLDACYAFFNWWHSGFAGSVLLSEGYYCAVQATSRRFMSRGAYAYWVDGKPADRTYPGPFGDPSVQQGNTRDGGSFLRRASRISSWISTPREYDYFLDRWQVFISTF